MRQTVLLQLTDEELILGEIDQLPNPADQFMIIHKPRQRNGTILAHLQENVPIIFHGTRLHMFSLCPEAGLMK